MRIGVDCANQRYDYKAIVFAKIDGGVAV